MAIKGAFSAGLIKGFATSMEQGIKDRQARMDELISNQMDTVKRSAPKLAQSMAEAKNAQMIMGEMKSQFGVTEEEFIALAQNYDINAVYGAVQKAQAALPEGSKLDKSQFLGSLNIPKGTTLPEGMTAEQAIESIYLGYARNVNEKPGDKSETHKNRSWGKALKDTLMLDPRASAEEQLQAMSYMGMPVNEIVQYEASAGSGYKPIQGVERVQGFDINTTDYQEKDYMSTASTYERTFTRTFAGTDDLANVTDMQSALDAIGAPDKAALGNKLRKGGTAIADLELKLSESGMQSTLERDRTLLRLSNEVNTAEEMDNLIAAVDDGTASEIIMESMKKHGRLTNEYIDYILTGEMPSEEGSGSGSGSGTGDDDDIATLLADTEKALAETGSGDSTVNAILANAPAEAREDTSEGFQPATMGATELNTPKVRGELTPETENRGLFSRTPEGEPEAEPKEPAPKPVMTAPELITEYGQDIITGLMDMGVTAEDGPEEFKQALADWFGENEGKLGSFTLAGSSVSIDMLADVFKRTFDNLAKQ